MSLVKMGSYCRGVSPESNMTGVPIKRGDVWTPAYAHKAKSPV